MALTSARRTTGALPSALLLAGLALLWTGERLFGTGDSRLICSGAGAALVLLGSALRVLTLSRAQGDARQVELRLLFSYVGVMVALLLYAMSTAPAMEMVGLDDAATSRVRGSLGALWPSVMIVALAALLFMELVYVRMPVADSVELRRVSTAAHAGLTLAFSAVFLLSANYVASERDVRRDLSYFKTTRPGEATRKLVASLERPVRVMLFFAGANDVLGQLRPYFGELSKLSERISVEVVDHAMVPGLAKKHRIRDNGEVLFLLGGETKPRDDSTDGGGKPTGKGSKKDPDPFDNARGESFRVGTDLAAARSVLKKLDATVQQHLTKLTLVPRSLWLTVGHGERNAQRETRAAGEGINGLKSVLRRLNVRLEQLRFGQDLAVTVPDPSGAIAVLGPEDGFLEEEASALLEFARKGGRLLLLLDADSDHGLAPLLSGLGLKQLPGVVASDKHHMRKTHTAADHTIVFSNRYSSHASVTTMSRHSREVATVLYRGSAFAKVDNKVTPEPTVVFTLRGAGDFWRDLNANNVRDSAEPHETLQLAAAVTFPRKEGHEGRVVIIGDGDLVSDRLVRNAGNSLLFVDALAWLIGEEKLSGEVSSEEDVPIEHTQEKDKLWFYATTFAVPAPILLLGVWIARRRRQKGEATA